MLRFSKKKVLNILVCIVLFLPFCITTTFSYIMPTLYQLARYLRMVFCVITVISAFVIIKNIWKQWPILLTVVLYLGMLCFSTVYNHINISFFLNYAVTVLFFVFFFELAVHRAEVEIFTAIWWICFILTCINIASVIFYPNGLYLRYDVTTSLQGVEYWFLGNRNLFIDFLFPLLSIALFLRFIKQETNIRFYVSLFLSVLTVSLSGSATSIFVISIIGIYFFVIRNKIGKKIINPIFLTTGYVVVSIMIIGFSSVDLFYFFVVTVFGKSITLSSRVSIWRNVINHIKLSPWIGYGYRSGTNFISNSRVMHAHNLFLHIAYSGGIISVILLIILISCAVLKINAYKKNDELHTLCTMVFFAYLWMEFSETRIYFPYLFGLIVILWNIQLIDDARVRLNEKKIFPVAGGK